MTELDDLSIELRIEGGDLVVELYDVTKSGRFRYVVASSSLPIEQLADALDKVRSEKAAE